MKIQFLTTDSDFDEEGSFTNLFIDPGLIQGFWIPDGEEEKEEKAINLIYPGLDIISAKQTKELKDFLVRKFVEKKYDTRA